MKKHLFNFIIFNMLLFLSIMISNNTIGQNNKFILLGF